MLRKAGVCATLVALLALVATISPTAHAAKGKHDAITPGAYKTAPIPGAESLGTFLYRFHVFSHEGKPLRAKGRNYYLQSAAFFKWTKESTVPADGIVHWCGWGRTYVSPPGLPGKVAAGIFEGEGDIELNR